MAGIKGRSGRKKTPKRTLEDYLRAHEDDMPEILQALVDRAKSGDSVVGMYLVDRYYGKPRQGVDFKGQLLTASADALLESVTRAQELGQASRQILEVYRPLLPTPQLQEAANQAVIEGTGSVTPLPTPDPDSDNLT